MIINPHMGLHIIHTSPVNLDPLILYVQVTQEDIDHGCKGNSGNCPIARAIRRETLSILPRYIIRVCSSEILLHSELSFYLSGIRSTPEVVATFIRRFDNGESVIPFNFILTLKKHEY